MSKANVEIQKLKPFVVMPEAVEIAFSQWLESIPAGHSVDVRYPYEKHGLSGHTSNSAKIDVEKDFLVFVDNNSQPNGQRLDLRNPTHYIIPKFKTISEPKDSVKNAEEKKATSLVSEFNRAQAETGKGTIDSKSALSWLKIERPKVASPNGLLRFLCGSQERDPESPANNQ